MARIFRQALRMLFAIEACGIIYVLGLAPLAGNRPVAGSPGQTLWSYGIGTAAFAVYAAAFWTTRKPLPGPNAPAMAASLLNVSLAALLLFRITPSHSPTRYVV